MNMRYNFNFLKKQYLKSILKYGKIRSNFFRLKKIFRYIYKLLYNINKKIKLYLIKLNYKKGDNVLIGELGIFLKNKKYILK